MKKLLKRAGLEGKQTVFLFTDTQILQESFLEVCLRAPQEYAIKRCTSNFMLIDMYAVLQATDLMPCERMAFHAT